MPSPEEALARIDGLMQIGLALALSTASGRIVLAKVADHLDPSWIPSPLQPRLGPVLERAAASRPAPVSLTEVERILTSAWGVQRVSDELESLEPEPAAVTFTSQVHRGVRDGAPVAVKVLRPGLAAAVRQDLMLFETLIAPVRGAFPGLDPGALLAETRERAMDELDLENEAGLMRRVGRRLRDSPVVVPVPVTELCGETVLVSSWLDGTSLAAGVGCEPDSTAAALLQYVIGGLREGLVPCDLDAADVLILADGRIGVVDHGAVTTFDPRRADLALAVLDAFIAEDPVALDAGLGALGVLESGHGDSALAVLTAALGPLGGADPSRLDVAAITAALRRMEGLEAEAGDVLLAARMAPGDLYPARGIAQLVSLIARLGASGVWRDQVHSALVEGWRN